MKKKSPKSIITIILVFIAALCYFSMNIYATETPSQTKGSGKGSCINPIYENLIDPHEEHISHIDNISSSSSQVETFTHFDAAVSYLRENLKNRKTTIKFKFHTKHDVDKLLYDFVNSAMKHTGVPTEGDYLNFQYDRWTGEYKWTKVDDVYEITFTYHFHYYTDADQEAIVDSAVEHAISKLNLNGKSDYQKIRAIYDYIIENVSYDYVNLNKDGYNLKYTAYAALHNKTAVCQGYTVLLYRMLLSQGIDCRIVTGTSHCEAHAWNIVELEDKYYNMDATWDSETGKHDYFLKCEGTFKDHNIGSTYLSSEFKEKHPMGKHDFNRYRICKACLSHNSFTYNGKIIKPEVTVKDGEGHTLSNGEEYSATYVKPSSRVGSYKVRIKGKGDYEFAKVLKYKINPQPTTLGRLTSIDNGFKVTWKKQRSQTTGYQIRYSAKSSMSSAKTVTISKNTTASKTVSKLKDKKKYYIQIRTFTKVDGVKYYSSWSKKKSVITK